MKDGFVLWFSCSTTSSNDYAAGSRFTFNSDDCLNTFTAYLCVGRMIMAVRGRRFFARIAHIRLGVQRYESSRGCYSNWNRDVFRTFILCLRPSRSDATVYKPAHLITLPLIIHSPPTLSVLALPTSLNQIQASCSSQPLSSLSPLRSSSLSLPVLRPYRPISLVPLVRLIQMYYLLFPSRTLLHDCLMPQSPPATVTTTTTSATPASIISAPARAPTSMAVSFSSVVPFK